MATALALDPITQSLRARGIKGSLVTVADRLFWRCTATDAAGERKNRRIPLGLPANPGMLVQAETRVVALAAEIARTGVLPEPLPWAAPVPAASGGGSAQPAVAAPAALTVADAAARLEASFWRGKVRTAAAERTWDRIANELQRLPQAATITVPLLMAVAGATAAGSRTRLESCKVFKRLGRIADLEGLEALDTIRTPYEPGARDLPSDGELRAVLAGLPAAHPYSWPTWALITYGCRPSEVFSLQPDDDGTARVLTVKRKARLPTWRTALALPLSPAPSARSVPLEVASPAAYDSLQAKRKTQAWGKWLSRRSGGIQLYDLRHAWAVRSIRRGVPTGLAAKTMGHEISVHSRTYHRWLDQADVAAFAAAAHTHLGQAG